MSSMFCTKIYQCKNADWCARDFNPKSDGAPKCFEPMTNADRIRQMSDEELARWCNDYNFNCPPVECEENGCEKCWLDWLRQEVNDVDFD